EPRLRMPLGARPRARAGGVGMVHRRPFRAAAAVPDLHIYHFGVYEPGAIKRLVLRYATREEEVDRLLRGKVFVDLHGVIKQGVRASVEQYSLKDMERFCGYRRRV